MPGPRELRLVKYEALGNDFLVLEGELPGPEAVRRLCHRRRGVGADGLLALDPAGSRLALANADGSPAGFSGNGVRCAALHLATTRGLGPELTLELGGRPIACRVEGERVRAALPPPPGPARPAGAALAEAVAAALGAPREAWEVDVGNPHLVLVAAPDEPVPGDALEELRRGAPGYPGGVNVSWYAPGAGGARVRTHERGVGPTPSCASGALACYLVGVRRGELAGRACLQVPGGELTLGGPPGAPWIEGPVRRVHEARWCG